MASLVWKGDTKVDALEPHLADGFGRRFPYLRLSVTGVCNFCCSYCLPNGYQKMSCESFLNRSEIKRLVRAFAGLGVRKIFLIGGEGGYSLRPWLQEGDQCEELQDKIINLMSYKKSTHFLYDGLTGVAPLLAFIGG